MKFLYIITGIVIIYLSIVTYANRHVGHRSLIAMSGSGNTLGEIELNMKWDWWPILINNYNARIIAIGEVDVLYSTYSGHADKMNKTEQYEMHGNLATIKTGRSVYYIPHAGEFAAIFPNIRNKDSRDAECLRLK